jgi:hypothetical protein
MGLIEFYFIAVGYSLNWNASSISSFLCWQKFILETLQVQDFRVLELNLAVHFIHKVLRIWRDHTMNI